MVVPNAWATQIQFPRDQSRRKRGLSKHTRSPEAQERRLQRREARRIVQRFEFRDYELSESVNMLTPEKIAELLGAVFPEGITYNFAARYERGEVLLDSRGRGSCQRD